MQFGQLWDFADGGAETSSGGELGRLPPVFQASIFEVLKMSVSGRVY